MDVHDFATSAVVEARWAPTLDRWIGESYPLRPATSDDWWAWQCRRNWSERREER